LYEHAPCGYLSIWSDGKILKANQTLCEWLDIDKESLVSQKYFQDLMTMGGKIFFDTHLAPLLRMRGEATEVKMTLKGNNAIKIPVLMNVKRIDTFLEGKTVYRFSVLNITQRNQYENELKVAKKQAEAALLQVREMKQTLEAYVQDTTRQLKGPLEDNLSHLKSLREKESELPTQAKETLNTLHTNTHLIKGMIQDLHDFTEPDKDRHLTPVHLEEVFQEVCDALKTTIETRGVHFQTDSLPEVMGVRSQVRKLLHELLSAAIQYASQPKPKVTITWKSTAYSNVILIQYIGKPLKDKAETPGFHTKTKDTFSGISPSINLNICQEIIERNKGYLKLESIGEENMISLAFPIEDG